MRAALLLPSLLLFSCSPDRGTGPDLHDTQLEGVLGPTIIQCGERHYHTVRLLDAEGRPIARGKVRWEGTGVESESSLTDENGIAGVYWTFTSSGSLRLSAYAAGGAEYTYLADVPPCRAVRVVFNDSLYLVDAVGPGGANLFGIKVHAYDVFGNDVAAQNGIYWFLDGAPTEISIIGFYVRRTPGMHRVQASVNGLFTPEVPLAVSIAPMLSLGGSHGCMLRMRSEATREVLCWGRNSRGQTTGTDPSTIPHWTGSVGRQVSAGREHSCAINATHGIDCWGANEAGQLGDGTRSDRAIPAAVTSTREYFRVSAGSDHTCALTRAGEAFCWGSNEYGQLGNDVLAGSTVPKAVAGELRFFSISAGTHFTCALALDESAYCWGRNDVGQLGDGTLQPRFAPTRVLLDAPLATIDAGGAHACAAGSDGSGWCWGSHDFGQLGSGTPPGGNSPAPQRIQSSIYVLQIDAGLRHTCAVERRMRYEPLESPYFVHCWGWGGYGQLGTGSTADFSSPQLASTAYALQVSTGDTFSCAMGMLQCWGDARDYKVDVRSTTHLATCGPDESPCVLRPTLHYRDETY